MQNYRMKIAYDGRKYKGFGKSRGDSEKSVQGKLEAILTKMYKKEIEVVGAVNTGAGVHAKGQIVNFSAPNSRMGKNEIFEYLEEYLTDDIIIMEIDTVEERFQSRYLAKSATYEYRLWKKDAANRPLFERKYVNLLKQKVDVSKMREAAADVVGEHDFLAFTSNRKAKKTIKEVVSLDVKETKNEIIIKISANGFLLNMERFVVGTLVQVGMGQLPLDTFEKAFKYRDAEYVGHKASADGLCLLGVEY